MALCKGGGDEGVDEEGVGIKKFHLRRSLGEGGEGFFRALCLRRML